MGYDSAIICYNYKDYNKKADDIITLLEFSGTGACNRLWRYDAPTDKWTELSGARLGRIKHQLICHDRCLYAVGGEVLDTKTDSMKASAICEKYNIGETVLINGPNISDFSLPQDLFIKINISL